jgi:hypothetical protein
LYRERARDWRGASDPEGLGRSLRREAQRMERSGTPQSPVRRLACGCAQDKIYTLILSGGFRFRGVRR